MRFTRKNASVVHEVLDPEADLEPRRRRMLHALVIGGALTFLFLLLWISQVEGYAIVLGQEIPIRSEGFGQILWSAESGSRVKKGERILQLDDSLPVLRLKEIEAELAEAHAQLDLDKKQMERELSQLRAREGEARIDLAKEAERVAINRVDLELDEYVEEKTDSLFDLQLVSEREQKQVRHARAATKVALSSGKSILQRRRKQLSDIQSVIEAHFQMMAQREQLGDARIRALETKVARYRREVETTVIRAPADGVVANAYAPTGALVNVGDTVLSIVDSSELAVAVFVPESEVGNVNLNVHESVRVRFNAHPMRAVPATVTEEYARLSSQPTLVPHGLDPYLAVREGLVLASKANVKECPFELRPGMTGTVILGRRSAFWPIEVALGVVTRTVGL